MKHLLISCQLLKIYYSLKWLYIFEWYFICSKMKRDIEITMKYNIFFDLTADMVRFDHPEVIGGRIYFWPL